MAPWLARIFKSIIMITVLMTSVMAGFIVSMLLYFTLTQ